MALTRTTADEVRAVLGVSDEELEDLTLDLKVFTDQLELELSDIDSTLPALLDSILATPVLSRTAAQTKVFTIANLFSAYAYGRILLTSLPLFSPKKVTDGRAEFERFADPFEAVRNGVNAGYVSIRARLQAALTLLSGYTPPAAITPIFTIAAPLAVDPVTA
jgi:hypothetical protein